MTTSDALMEARREARGEAIAFVLVAAALLTALAAASLSAGWELVDLEGWVWLVLCVPEALLVGAFLASSRVSDHDRAHRMIELFLGFVGVGNLGGLVVLVAALLSAKTSELSGGQLLASGGVVWLTNVIVFGLWFWTFDGGGPVRRAREGRARPDFQFPQDENPSLTRPGWHPRLADYVYVALTNGIAFSPTDALPLTRGAKALMALESTISVVAVLLVGARAVNVLGS
jgi:hypothetical protein